MNKIYEIITKKICEQLEKGFVPWQKPWSTGGRPKNFKTGHHYRGINTFLLGSAPYISPYWLTYKQAQELGGSVKKGEKGSLIVFFKEWQIEDEATGDEKKIPVLRYYKGFNAQQIEGIDFPEVKPLREDHNPIPECESIVEAMPDKPKIFHGMEQCSYHTSLDEVYMPDPKYFVSGEEYYSSLFHELTHSTGHESRLDRRGFMKTQHLDNTDRNYEELIAEMGSAFLCGDAGILERTLDNSVAYAQGWLKVLRKDPKMVVLAAGQAQKAVDFILQNK